MKAYNKIGYFVAIIVILGIYGTFMVSNPELQQNFMKKEHQFRQTIHKCSDSYAQCLGDQECKNHFTDLIKCSKNKFNGNCDYDFAQNINIYISDNNMHKDCLKQIGTQLFQKLTTGQLDDLLQKPSLLSKKYVTLPFILTETTTSTTSPSNPVSNQPRLSNNVTNSTNATETASESEKTSTEDIIGIIVVVLCSIIICVLICMFPRQCQKFCECFECLRCIFN